MYAFNFSNYKDIFRCAMEHNYQIITVADYFQNTYDATKPILVNRIDVDIKFNRLKQIYTIFKELGIKASVYTRLHAPDYNMFSIGNIKIIQNLLSIGCELGLHTELEDLKGYCKVDREKILKAEINLFEAFFGYKMKGTASHGDMTAFNNLDFWKHHKPEDFGLTYEGYDQKLWGNCRYVSESEWVQWKSYQNGVLRQDDRRDPTEHIKQDKPAILLLLTHPETWYEHYIYE